MTNRSPGRVVLFALTVSVCVGSAARAAEDPPVAAARDIFARHQDSVVWVSAVMKMRAGGGLGAMFGRQEQKVEAVGTVIHESGLVVLSYTMLDPSAMLNAAMANVGGGEENKVEFKTELSGVKIRLADGTEIPGKLVLRDDDLDLAFVMPTEKGKKIPYVALGGGGGAGAGGDAGGAGAGTGAGNEAGNDGPAVKPLDPLVVIWRLGQNLDRQPAVALGRVSAVVTKPRTFYLVSGLESLGTPAFTADGKALGIVVMRKQIGDGGMGGMFSAAGGGGIAAVVVPAADVMEVAQQALMVHPDAPEGANLAPSGAQSPEDAGQPPAKQGKSAADKPGPAGDGEAPAGGTKVPPGGAGRRGQ